MATKTKKANPKTTSNRSTNSKTTTIRGNAGEDVSGARASRATGEKKKTDGEGGAGGRCVEAAEDGREAVGRDQDRGRQSGRQRGKKGC